MFDVVVPTYNRAHLLPRCLRSILAQSDGDFTLTVADDGSTDDTARVVTEFRQEDSRVAYARQDNCGAGDARNLGASRTSRPWLVFLDSDDEARPPWLAELRRATEQGNPAVVCCGISFANGDGHIVGERLPAAAGTGLPILSGLYRSGTFAIRRDVFQAIGGYASGLAANQHSELRCRLAKGARQEPWLANCVGESLILAHDHGGPKIRRNTPGVYASACYVLQHHSDLLQESPSSYASWATACAGLAARLQRYGEARAWLLRAAQARPRQWKTYARLLVACLPGLRSRVWRPTAQTPVPE